MLMVTTCDRYFHLILKCLAPSGKGPSIWDALCHTFPERIVDRSNGDIAADSYHLYKEDVQMLKKANVMCFRFDNIVCSVWQKTFYYFSRWISIVFPLHGRG